MQVKSAMMKAPGSFTVSSNTGHTISFKAGEEKFVPGIMVNACKKYGAVVTKLFSDTLATYTGGAEKVNTEIHAVPHAVDMEAVEEVTLSSVQEDEQVGSTESERFTEKENRIRGVINTMVMTADERAFTSEGVPKTAVVNKMLQDFSIDAGTRDEVWAKMNRLGEIPKGWYADDASAA